MWAQNWQNILDITVPYPNRPFIDVSQNMRQQGYTPSQIYRTAENFYRSLGFEPLPISFQIRSMLAKPRNRKVVCSASAWDFCNGVDYRLSKFTFII